MTITERQVGGPNPIEHARKVFNPENMGFTQYKLGWEKNISGIGPVAFMSLGWEHGHVKASLSRWERHGNALELLSRIHQKTFGTSRRDAMSPYLAGAIDSAGGSLVVAYERDKGFNHDSWLGFGIVLGGNDQKAISAFIGVNEKTRDKKIAPHIRLIQMHLALASGKTEFGLEFGPLRGRMANETIRLLRASVDTLISEKYPSKMRFRLYGRATDDRLKASFKLLDPKTQARMTAIANGTSNEFIEEPLQHREEGVLVTDENLEQILTELPATVRYEIPAEADTMRYRKKQVWRDQMVRVLGSLLTHERPIVPEHAKNDVAAASKEKTEGIYTITHFTTTIDDEGKRRNTYELTRNDLLDE